jgi:hypothetical protein
LAYFVEKLSVSPSCKKSEAFRASQVTHGWGTRSKESRLTQALLAGANGVLAPFLCRNSFEILAPVRFRVFQQNRPKADGYPELLLLTADNLHLSKV